MITISPGNRADRKVDLATLFGLKAKLRNQFSTPSKLFLPGKQAPAEPDLDCIDTGIR